MKISLYCLLLLFLTNAVVGQGTNQVGGQSLPGTNNIAAVSTNAQPSDKEIAVLKAQIELMQQYDQRLLATVYWALGGTFVMWGLINGFAWYANLRIYRRDHESLHSEISKSITEEKNRLREQIANDSSENTKRVEQLIGSKVKEISETVSAKIDSAKVTLESRINSLKSKSRDIDFQLASIEAKEWLAKGVHTNALRAYESMVYISIQQEQDWQISRTLEAIKGTIKEIIDKKSVKPDAVQVRELNLMLEKVPSSHETIVAAIRKQLDHLTA